MTSTLYAQQIMLCDLLWACNTQQQVKALGQIYCINFDEIDATFDQFYSLKLIS